MADRHQAPAYPLRLSAELKEKIQAAALESGRSFNAEVAFRLEESLLPQWPQGTGRVFLELERDRAAAELEKHVMVGQIEQLVFMIESLAVVITSGDAQDHRSLEALHEWVKEAHGYVDESRKRVDGNPADARVEYERAAADLREHRERFRRQADAMIKKPRQLVRSSPALLGSTETAKSQALQVAELSGKELVDNLPGADKEGRSALAHGSPLAAKHTTSEPAPTPAKKGSFSHLSRGKKLGK